MADAPRDGALYYPFSRCVDPAAMKQLLLMFESVTFVDPVDDDRWRAGLMKDIEAIDRRFANYRTIDACMPWLRRDGIVQVVEPSQLRSFDAQLTATATLSDLSEPEWVRVADPVRNGLPTQFDRGTREPIWEMFPEKVPSRVLEALSSNRKLSRHLVHRGGRIFTHVFTYAAGSAIGLNTHLAAADELGLAPVTSSALHHRLMMMKLDRGLRKRGSLRQPEIGASDSRSGTVARSAAIRLIGEILPPPALEALSLEQILEFRQRTVALRRAFVADVQREAESCLTRAEGPRAALDAEREVTLSLSQLTKAYGDEIAAQRDRLWPRLAAALASKTGYAGMTALGGTSVALAYITSPGFVLAASVALGVSLLKPAEIVLEWRAEHNATQRKATASVAYLSQVKSLSAER